LRKEDDDDLKRKNNFWGGEVKESKEGIEDPRVMSATITHPLARANSTGAVSEYPMIRSWTGAELMRSDLQSAERVRRANNPCCMAANVLTTLF
jgi:hypothetical protein